MIIDTTYLQLKNHKLELRVAEENDAELLIDYLKTTCNETKFLVKEPEEITMTLQEEKEFIQKVNESEHSVMLLGFLDGEYVGNCSLNGMSAIRYQHRASMGIALFQKYTGLGIGRAMITKLIEIATETGLEQIELEVVCDNKRAIHLYERMGFQIYGTFPNNMKYKDGTYADVYWMCKSLTKGE